MTCQFCGGVENVNLDLKTCFTCSNCCGCGDEVLHENGSLINKSAAWKSERGRVVLCGPCAPNYDKCDLCSWFMFTPGMVETWQTANGKMTHVCFHCHKQNRLEWAKSGWSYKTNFACVTPLELKTLREQMEARGLKK